MRSPSMASTRRAAWRRDWGSNGRIRQTVFRPTAFLATPLAGGRRSHRGRIYAAGGCIGENDRTTSTEEIAAPTSTAQVAAPTSTAQDAAPTSPADVAAQVAADVDAYLPAFDRHNQIRAVLVFHDGEPVLERYTGAGPEDYWDVRSVTKSVVSALIGIAIDQGYIDGVGSDSRRAPS